MSYAVAYGKHRAYLFKLDVGVYVVKFAQKHFAYFTWLYIVGHVFLFMVMFVCYALEAAPYLGELGAHAGIELVRVVVQNESALNGSVLLYLKVDCAM